MYAGRERERERERERDSEREIGGDSGHSDVFM
jgi:hypothetical protein